MEPKAKNAAIISIEPTENIDQIILPSHDYETNKSFQPRLKKNGSKNIFNVALFMMQRHSPKSKELPVDDESRRKWRKFIGSIRPLRLQSSQSLLKNPQTPNTMQSLSEIATKDGFDSIPNSPILPSPSNSRYASTIGLNELAEEEENKNEEGEKGIARDGGASGDDMIDAKAEEFIAEFYLQMKLQQFNAMDRHYREISQRSLGL